MKILHLLSQRPDSTGSGIYLQAMIEQATSHGHDNCLLAAVQSNQPANLEHLQIQESSFIHFEEDEIPYEIVGMSDIMPYNSRTFGSLTESELTQYIDHFTSKLKEAVASFKPDIIHSHHLWLLSSLAKIHFPEIPLTTTCHGTDLRQFINCPHLQSIVLRGCQKIEKVMALSTIQRDEISELYNIPLENIEVTGGGFNISLFENVSEPEKEPIQILYAGKLSSFKGVPHLLKSLATLSSLPFHFHLVGSSSGEELKNCQALAKKLNSKTTVHGAIPHEKLSKLMQDSHLFIFPSFFEGLPLVVLEALASGCQIITTDLPGIREIVEKTGTERIDIIPMPPLKTIDTPHPESIADFELHLSSCLKKHIEKQINEPRYVTHTSMGNVKYFSWFQVFKRVEKVYSSL